jgi:hypothetical protein
MADECIRWIASDECPGDPLDPWQVFFVREALAMRGGELLYPLVVLRVARQQGKTYALRRVMLWLLLHGDRWLGGPRRIVNTHPDGIQAVALMEPLARGAGYGRGGKPGVDSQTFMCVWHPGGPTSDDSVAAWFSRAMTVRALTGLPGITTALVDEIQDARSDPVQEGLFGAMSSRRVRNRQRWLAGTGEKPESVMLRSLKRHVGAPGVLWAEWSMPPGADPADEGQWPWGSPEWSPARLTYLREQQREVPQHVFQRNFLLSDEADPLAVLVDRARWRMLVAEPAGPAAGVAVEARLGDPPVVATAFPDGRGGHVVGVRQARSIPEALDWCAGAPRLLVGKSMARDPRWLELGADPAGATGAEMCGRLLQLLSEGLFSHDGGPVLTGQVLSTTVRATPAGVRVTSSERIDAIKAAVWAVDAAGAGAGSPVIY